MQMRQIDAEDQKKRDEKEPSPNVTDSTMWIKDSEEIDIKVSGMCFAFCLLIAFLSCVTNDQSRPQTEFFTLPLL